MPSHLRHRPTAQEPLVESAARTVWVLAWPAVALNSLQVVNSLIDRAFLGRLEPAALTALGGATNVMFMMFSLGMALGTAATAIVSRAYGARQIEEFRAGSRQSLSLAMGSGVLFGALCALATPIAATLVPESDPRARELLVQFLLVYSAGLPAMFVIQALAGSLRAVGDTRSPMLISGLQILLHVVLSFMFIFPPHQLGGATLPGFNLGFVGAAIGLSGSAWVAAIGYVLYAGRTPIGAQWRIEFPRPAWAVRILKVAVPAAVMSTLRVAALTAFTVVLASVPNASVALATMPMGFALEAILFMPPAGLSMAAAALVGQSLGMQDPRRADRLGWVAAHHGAVVTVLCSLPLFVFAPQIAGALLPGKDAIAQETGLLIRLMCATEVLFSYSMILIGAMQGAGDTRGPLWITVLSLWGLRVPLALVLALGPGAPLGSLGVSMPFGFAMGSLGAWLSMSFTQGVLGVLSLWLFKRGRWKTQTV